MGCTTSKGAHCSTIEPINIQNGVPIVVSTRHHTETEGAFIHVKAGDLRGSNKLRSSQDFNIGPASSPVDLGLPHTRISVGRELLDDFDLVDRLEQTSRVAVEAVRCKCCGRSFAAKTVYLQEHVRGNGIYDPHFFSRAGKAGRVVPFNEIPPSIEERTLIAEIDSHLEVGICPTIANLHAVYYAQPDPTAVTLVMDLGIGGNLRKLLKRRAEKFFDLREIHAENITEEHGEKGQLPIALTENEARVVFYDLLTALKALHQRGIAHRDIKPENVVLKNSRSPADGVLLVDLSYSSRKENMRRTSLGGQFLSKIQNIETKLQRPTRLARSKDWPVRPSLLTEEKAKAVSRESERQYLQEKEWKESNGSTPVVAESHQTKPFSAYCGTPRYMPPEVILVDPQAAKDQNITDYIVSSYELDPFILKSVERARMKKNLRRSFSEPAEVAALRLANVMNGNQSKVSSQVNIVNAPRPSLMDTCNLLEGQSDHPNSVGSAADRNIHIKCDELFSLENYDCTCDIWSLGALFYECVLGFCPFDSERIEDVFGKILSGKLSLLQDGVHPRLRVNQKNRNRNLTEMLESRTGWWSLSPELRNLIFSMLRVNPSERLSVDKALNHAFFSGPIDSNSLYSTPERVMSRRTSVSYSIQSTKRRYSLSGLSVGSVNTVTTFKKTCFHDPDNRNVSGFAVDRVRLPIFVVVDLRDMVWVEYGLASAPAARVPSVNDALIGAEAAALYFLSVFPNRDGKRYREGSTGAPFLVPDGPGAIMTRRTAEERLLPAWTSVLTQEIQRQLEYNERAPLAVEEFRENKIRSVFRSVYSPLYGSSHGGLLEDATMDSFDDQGRQARSDTGRSVTFILDGSQDNGIPEGHNALEISTRQTSNRQAYFQSIRSSFQRSILKTHPEHVDNLSVEPRFQIRRRRTLTGLSLTDTNE